MDQSTKFANTRGESGMVICLVLSPMHILILCHLLLTYNHVFMLTFLLIIKVQKLLLKV